MVDGGGEESGGSGSACENERKQVKRLEQKKNLRTNLFMETYGLKKVVVGLIRRGVGREVGGHSRAMLLEEEDDE